MEKLLISTNEACKLLGICRNTLKKTDFTVYRLGPSENSHPKYCLEEIKEYIEAKRRRNSLESKNAIDQLVASWEYI